MFFRSAFLILTTDRPAAPKLYSRFLASLLTRQQAAEKEVRARVRKPSSNASNASSKGISRSPPNNISTATHPLDEFPPAPPQPLYLTPDAPRGLVMMPQQGLGHAHTDGLLHVEHFSDAGTETTVDGRHSQDAIDVSADDMLASMQALSNPAWWNGVMMPGYSWPQQESPVYAAPAYVVPQPQYQQHAPAHGSYLLSR